MQKCGANTPIEGLRQIPIFLGTTATENDSNGGDGTAFINLYGLGSNNVLTLINGRRAFSFSDINAIPISALARAEILKHGGGAIYGAGAVAGVFNFILINGPGERPYEGAELHALYGNTTDADAHVRQVYVRGGITGLDGKVSESDCPFVFALDTGAEGGPRLDSSLMERLGLKSTGQMRNGDPSGRNPRMADTVKLDSLEVGGLRFTDVAATSRNYKNSPRPLAADGIIGLALFSDYLLTLDFPARVFRISRGELPKADGAEILDYQVEHGVPSVELSVGTARIKAHLDSGNRIGAFVFPTSFIEKLTQVSEPVVVGRARSASGEMEIKQVRIKEMVRLGRHEFPDATVTFPALGDTGNVGGKILSQFAVTFDQRHQRVRLVARPG